MIYNGKEIKTVWVDLDDTLIDFKANSRRALTNLYNKENLGRYWPTPGSWYSCYEKYNMALWTEYNLDRISRDYLIMERFRRPLVEAGFTDAEARTASPRLSTEYLDFLAAEKQTEPGAVELLRDLRAAGVKIGILSNGFKEVQYRKIHSAGLDPYIDLTVLSDDIGVNKPDPRIYEYAATRSGQDNPTAHLMIGDNPDTDIAGALAAGWEAIGYFKGQKEAIEHNGKGYTSVNSLPLIAPLLSKEQAAV